MPAPGGPGQHVCVYIVSMHVVIYIFDICFLLDQLFDDFTKLPVSIFLNLLKREEIVLKKTKETYLSSFCFLSVKCILKDNDKVKLCRSIYSFISIAMYSIGLNKFGEYFDEGCGV